MSAGKMIVFAFAGLSILSGLGAVVLAIAAMWATYPVQGQLGGTAAILAFVTLISAGISAAAIDAGGLN